MALRPKVSILVFLEPLLRPDSGLGRKAKEFSFQSLFFWNHCLDLDGQVKTLAELKFQSLFFWNHCLDLPVPRRPWNG